MNDYTILYQKGCDTKKQQNHKHTHSQCLFVMTSANFYAVHRSEQGTIARRDNSPLIVQCDTGELMKENEIHSMLASFRFARNRLDRAIEALEDILKHDINED